MKQPKPATAQPRPAPAPAATPRIAKMAVAAITPANYNPRTISEDALAGLGESVDRFGLVQLLVWNIRTERLVGGHQRLRVLIERRVEYTDVVVVDLDEIEEKALNITLNNPHIAGEFTGDLQKLLGELAEVDGDWMEDLRLDELADDVDIGDPVKAVSINIEPVRDIFWMTVRGPLAAQADALRVIREQLAALEGVEVELGTVTK